MMAFIQDPSMRTLAPIRKQLVQSSEYDPYSHRLDGIDDMIESGLLIEAAEALAACMAHYILSPRAHLMAAYLLREVAHDRDAADTEERIYAACIEGILSTGNGTENNPYLITFSSDENDILEYLDKDRMEQSLRHSAEHHYDVMLTSDGDEIWFDITDLYDHFMKSLQPGSS